MSEAGAPFLAADLDLRDGDGNALSPLLDRHAFDRSLTNDWSTSRYVFRVPAGEYRVLARGASGDLRFDAGLICFP